MFKFYRKIRQNLLLKNNTRKYLRYAIGEILLVVLGILIAVQINTWNSNKLNEERNNLLLIKLSKELDLNIERIHLLDTINHAFKGRLIFTDSLLKILNKGVTINDLDFMIRQSIYYTTTLNFNSTVFQELKNTGSLYAIGSDSLIQSIQNYYQLCEREAFYNLEFGVVTSNRQEKCYEGWYNFKYEYELNPKEAVKNNQWIFDKKSIHYIYLRQYVENANYHSGLINYKLGRIKEETEKLKELISNEIVI